MAKRKRPFSRFLIFVLICIVVFASTTFIAYNFFVKYGEEYVQTGKIEIPPEEQEKFVVEPGASAEDIAYKLKEEGYIKYPELFKFLSRYNGYDLKYKAGTHIISKKLNYDAIMQILTSDPIAKPTKDIRIPEGLTFVELRDYLSQKKYVDKERFEALCKSKRFDDKYKFLRGIERKYRLEGYLYPDTYKIEIDSNEEKIIDCMLREFDRVFKPEYYERAKQLNMTVDEVITLASIIEMEVKYPKDYKLVSSVFHNRLRSKTISLRRLQSDATIQYARIMQGLGRTKQVLYKDLNIDSPYNTYKIQGLPPGPICSPRIEAIEAALYPKDTNYYFFFATKEGINIYNKTYSGHIRDQKKYGIIK